MARSAAGQKPSEATASNSDGGGYATVAEALESVEVDVLVDYTSAAAVRDNVWAAVRAGVHVVTGSSGLTAEDHTDLDRLARDQGVGVKAAAVLQGARRSPPSPGKPDVPSGTARELAEAPSGRFAPRPPR